MTEHRACGVAEVADGAAHRVDIDGERIAVVRIGDEWFAIGDRCSHQDISLSEGEVHPESCELECWKHGSTFSLRTGKPSCLPATRPVPVYGVRVAGDDVLVML